jgi:hypothetical protein
VCSRVIEKNDTQTCTKTPPHHEKQRNINTYETHAYNQRRMKEKKCRRTPQNTVIPIAMNNEESKPKIPISCYLAAMVRPAVSWVLDSPVIIK